jgi:hypothetical protein
MRPSQQTRGNGLRGKCGWESSPAATVTAYGLPDMAVPSRVIDSCWLPAVVTLLHVMSQNAVPAIQSTASAATPPSVAARLPVQSVQSFPLASFLTTLTRTSPALTFESAGAPHVFPPYSVTAQVCDALAAAASAPPANHNISVRGGGNPPPVDTLVRRSACVLALFFA